ncbi:APC family permease [Rhodococcus qingshengii]|uniref:APC family permease n=1 Tax=Rhodococcus qingshengii TaxID=334542 RepID=UPI0024BA1604|nr:APC family permease [Rhodococcus qingshengii]MDJ0491400.1 APC family permease [Rhodococcus qingshengii]
MANAPHLRSSSPVAGLGRARLTFVQVLAQSISAVAPSAVMVTVPALVVSHAGHATIAVFAAAALLMSLVGYCVGQFAHRMVAVSGLYGYVVKGLGPVPGFGSGWSLTIGYAAAAMASILGSASYSTALLGRLGLPSGEVTIAVMAGLIGVVALGLMIRGVRFSTRITLAVEVVAIVLATTVLVVVLVQALGGPPTGPEPPSNESSQVGFALLLAITSFVGFESAGTVAREARNPLTAVPRAIKWTPLAVGCLYIGAAAAQLPAPIEQSDTLGIVLSLQDPSGASVILSVLMEIGITASWFACVLGSTTALSRTLFAMGREGVAPEALGRTHARFHTPHVALLVAMPVIVAVPVVYQFRTESTRDVLIGLLTLSAHGYVIAYILVCVATPLFLRRIGESTPMPAIIAVAAASLLTALVVWAALSRAYIAGVVTVIYLGLMIIGFGVLVVRTRFGSGVLDRVGVYDETIADDLLDDYRPWEVRK